MAKLFYYQWPIRFLYIYWLYIDWLVYTYGFQVLEGKCGECDLCLKACQTGALEGPYKFNPKKCVSYLTQTREKIPYELREKMGINIYGCDACQLACPKNKGIKKT